MNEVLVIFLVLIGTIVLGVPIPISVALATIAGYFLIDLPFVALAQSMYTGIEPIPLMTIPLFVFAGALMERGGLATRIVGVAQALVGRYTGSLGMVTVLGCTFFAALSGSGPATTAAIGAVMAMSPATRAWVMTVIPGGDAAPTRLVDALVADGEVGLAVALARFSTTPTSAAIVAGLASENPRIRAMAEAARDLALRLEAAMEAEFELGVGSDDG